MKNRISLIRAYRYFRLLGHTASVALLTARYCVTPEGE